MAKKKPTKKKGKKVVKKKINSIDAMIKRETDISGFK